jgi:hypothetical protein
MKYFQIYCIDINIDILGSLFPSESFCIVFEIYVFWFEEGTLFLFWLLGLQTALLCLSFTHSPLVPRASARLLLLCMLTIKDLHS